MTARFLNMLRAWDRTSRAALGLAILLLLIDLLFIIFGPFDSRPPAMIGLLGLVIAIQIIVLWANRGMVTPFTKAQRYYLDEDFEAAREILEKLRETGKADMRALTLLGNAHRQLGALDQSEAILHEALAIQPNHHFPLYGFGRTLLVQGNYSEAAETIRQALMAGAPPIVQLDAGEALYRAGEMIEARQMLQAALPSSQEPHRRLMAEYLLYRLGEGSVPALTLIEQGLPYWEANAERYDHTAYGQNLADDIRAMQTFMRER
jgi:tetratricopeptide (TPR) repeat protein